MSATAWIALRAARTMADGWCRIYPYMPLHHPTSHSDLANWEGKRLRAVLQEFASSLTA